LSLLLEYRKDTMPEEIFSDGKLTMPDPMSIEKYGQNSVLHGNITDREVLQWKKQ